MCGAGPSLAEIPRDFDSIPVIATNQAITHFEKVDYFFATDIGVLYCGYTDQIGKANEVYLHKNFNHPKYIKKLPKKFKTFKYRNHYEYKLDKSGDFIPGYSVPHTATTFAYWLGFKNIFLIGVDCDHKQGVWTIAEMNNEEYYLPENNWEHENRWGANIGVWSHIAKSNPEINIVDLSDGRVDCFKKMNVKNFLKWV